MASEGSQTCACSNVPLIEYRVTTLERKRMLLQHKTSGTEEMGVHYTLLRVAYNDGPIALVNQTINHAGQPTSIAQSL